MICGWPSQKDYERKIIIRTLVVCTSFETVRVAADVVLAVAKIDALRRISACSPNYSCKTLL